MLVSWLRCKPDCFFSLSLRLAFGFNCCEATGYEKHFQRWHMPALRGKENEKFRYELTSPFCFTSISQAGNFCRSGGFFSVFPLQTVISGEITWEDVMGTQQTGKSRECLGTWSQSNSVYIRVERTNTTLEKVLVLNGRCQSGSCSYFCLWRKLSPCACRSEGKKVLVVLSPDWIQVDFRRTFWISVHSHRVESRRERERKRERERENVRGRVLDFTRQWLSWLQARRGPPYRAFNWGQSTWKLPVSFLASIFFQTERVDCFTGTLHIKGKCLWPGRIRKQYRGWGGVGGVKGWVCTPPLFPVTI